MKLYAGFWIRVGATFIDFFVFLIPIGLSMANIYLWKSLILMFIINIAMIGYKPFMEYKYGATFGKMALKLKVLTSDDKLMTIQESLIRSIPWLISGIISLYTYFALMNHPLYFETEGFMNISKIQQEVAPMIIQYLASFLLFVSAIIVAFHKQKRGLHDIIAGTYCIDMSEPKQ